MSKTKIPRRLIDKLMVACKRKCFWCEEHKATEIHHIDQNNSNNDEDNLVACCPICHKEFHTQTPFALKITINELKMRRDNFYFKQSPYKVEKIEALGELKPTRIKIELIKENGK